MKKIKNRNNQRALIKVLKNIGLIFLIFLFFSSLFALLSPGTFEKTKQISFSQVVQDIKQGRVTKIEVSGNQIIVSYQNGKKARSQKEAGVSLIEELSGYGIKTSELEKIDLNIKGETGSFWTWLIPLLTLILPILLFGFFFWIIFKQAKAGAANTFNFLKSPAKFFNKKDPRTEKITFDDIADLKEAKQEIVEIVDFLRHPKKYLKMGARIPKGVLLVGAPGTGKTMLARAVANEADVPFFSIVGSEFVELFVGVGSSRTRHLFETAKKNAPSLIFIDELDAIGKIRMPGVGGSHEERENTLNQILAEMDGFEKDTGVIVLAATNRPEALDPALLRPGRFDRRIVLDLPDINGREEILKIHCRDKPLADDVDLREIAERTPGFSGADLANLANEAAILAAKRNKNKIEQTELLESIEKVLLGPERKSHLLTKKEKEVSAFHEAGHALVASKLANADEVRKVSIVARGLAAGYTLSSPKEEKKIKTKSEFLADLAVLLGGYVAEKIQFNEITTGAANDLEKASILARQLVTKYGMSKLGPISFGQRESLPFLGVERETERNYSEKVALQIDQETQRFLKEAENKAKKILTQNKKTLKKIANLLIEKETIEKEEFERLIGKRGRARDQKKEKFKI